MMYKKVYFLVQTENNIEVNSRLFRKSCEIINIYGNETLPSKAGMLQNGSDHLTDLHELLNSKVCILPCLLLQQ